MYQRELQEELEALARDYPVVTVIGPRQSGKTTLVKATFPQKPYVNLEALDTREVIEADPRAFLSQYAEGAILDEIQRLPSLLSYIQTIVDEKDQKGMFILTGSHQLELHHAISQSLAGRTALLTLLPLSLKELQDAQITLSLDEYILKGGYPRIFKDHLDPTTAYRNYFQTYVERDVRQILNVKDLAQFQKFIRLCAGRIGQLINFESLCNDVGVSSKTAKEWLSILEASFIIYRLQPYYENFGKRAIKTPKLYFTDVGLACYLLGIKEINQLTRDPLRGNLVENLIFLELLKARVNQGNDPDLYFFRDSHGHEVDLIFQSGNELIPIEIKSSQTFHKEFLENLHFFQELAGTRSKKGYLIYSGNHQRLGNIELLSFQNANHAIR